MQKITTGQGNDYTAVYLLDYPYSKNYNKMIAIDLTKQQAIDTDPNEIKQVNVTGNLERA